MAYTKHRTVILFNKSVHTNDEKDHVKYRSDHDYYQKYHVNVESI